MKRNFISPRANVLFSMQISQKGVQKLKLYAQTRVLLLKMLLFRRVEKEDGGRALMDPTRNKPLRLEAQGSQKLLEYHLSPEKKKASVNFKISFGLIN